MPGKIEKSRRLATWIIEELHHIEEGAVEAMEFWEKKEHHHFVYYRARRDLIRDVIRLLGIGIRRFFTDKDIDDAYNKREGSQA